MKAESLGPRRFELMGRELQIGRRTVAAARSGGAGDVAGLLVRAHMMLAEGLFYLGEFARARLHAEEGIARYDPQQHRSQAFRYGNDPGVGCRSFAALARGCWDIRVRPCSGARRPWNGCRSWRTPSAWGLR